MKPAQPNEVLRKARMARGYKTASDAARAFGWNAVTYAAHENGGRGLRIDQARRYARAFRIDVGELLGLNNRPPMVNEDERDQRIAELEAEVRSLRATIQKINALTSAVLGKV